MRKLSVDVVYYARVYDIIGFNDHWGGDEMVLYPKRLCLCNLKLIFEEGI